VIYLSGVVVNYNTASFTSSDADFFGRDRDFVLSDTLYATKAALTNALLEFAPVFAKPEVPEYLVL
jgi:hypothetical protein